MGRLRKITNISLVERLFTQHSGIIICVALYTSLFLGIKILFHRDKQNCQTTCNVQRNCKIRSVFQHWRIRKHRLKYFILILNFIEIILGITTVIVMDLSRMDKSLMSFTKMPSQDGSKHHFTKIEDEYSISDYVELTRYYIGAFSCIKGCTGIFIICRNERYLHAFGIIVAHIAIVQIFVIATYAIYRYLIITDVDKLMNYSLTNRYKGANLARDGFLLEAEDEFSQAWDILMARHSCCGMRNLSDFANRASKWSKGIRVRSTIIQAKVPITCCKLNEPMDYPERLFMVKFVNLVACLNADDVTYINMDSCYEVLVSRLFEITWWYTVLLWAMSFVDLSMTGGVLKLVKMLHRHSTLRVKYRALKVDSFQHLKNIMDLSARDYSNGIIDENIFIPTDLRKYRTHSFYEDFTMPNRIRIKMHGEKKIRNVVESDQSQESLSDSHAIIDPEWMPEEQFHRSILFTSNTYHEKVEEARNRMIRQLGIGKMSFSK